MEHHGNGTVGRLLLDGARTVRTADDTHAALLAMTASHAVLEIDCSRVEEADLSFIQLLLAARSGAGRSNRTVRLAQPASGALLDALQRGGFLAAITDQTASDRDFWLRPEAP